jgi:hypothetical protein
MEQVICTPATDTRRAVGFCAKVHAEEVVSGALKHTPQLSPLERPLLTRVAGWALVVERSKRKNFLFFNAIAICINLAHATEAKRPQNEMARVAARPKRR